MFGTLSKIEITEDLIMDVARELFARSDEESLDDQNNYVKGMWHDSACELLDDFNGLAEIFKKLKIECCVNTFGCGHDVNEFYED